MAFVEDIANEIMGEAGKSGSTNKATAKRAVMAAIATINSRMDFEVFKDRKKDLSLTANATSLTIPGRIKTVIEIGGYDSSTDRIKVPWDESDEVSFHRETEGASSLSATEAGSKRFWFFLDMEADKDRQIRVFPPATGTTTVMVRFFEAIDDGNANRLPNVDLLRLGAKTQLAGWFPSSAGLDYRMFYDGIEQLKGTRPSTKRTTRKHQRPDIAAHNAAAADLVR